MYFLSILIILGFFLQYFIKIKLSNLLFFIFKRYNAFFLFFLNNIHSYNKYIHISSYINKKNQKKKLSSIVLKTYRLPVVINAQTAHRIIGADGNHHLCISNTEQQSMLVSCLMVFSFSLFLYNI